MEPKAGKWLVKSIWWAGHLFTTVSVAKQQHFNPTALRTAILSATGLKTVLAFQQNLLEKCLYIYIFIKCKLSILIWFEGFTERELVTDQRAEKPWNGRFYKKLMLNRNINLEQCLINVETNIQNMRYWGLCNATALTDKNTNLLLFSV